MVTRQLSDWEANLILSRITAGPTQESREQLKNQGLSSWLKLELATPRPETHPLLRDRTVFLSNSLNLEQTFTHPNYRRRYERVAREAAALALLKRLYSVNQVRESLVEFVSDYLPVPLYSAAEWARMDYDRTVRSGVLRTYPELLQSLSLHPAMLFYLNGQTNTAETPNENFGRELLELFTVTPAAKYSEQDVLNAARMLSGISFNLIRFETLANPVRHHFGRISLLGFSHGNQRTESSTVILSRARQMIAALALTPATARAFSHRMAKRFVSDQPPQEITKAMEATYLATKGSIPAVFTTMATHPLFMSSQPTKVKRPSDHLTSSMRALGIQPLIRGEAPAAPEGFVESETFNQLLSNLDKQGHVPFDWDTPDGFPDHAAAWSTFGSQVQRWNLTTKLSQNLVKNQFSAPAFSSSLLSYSSHSSLVEMVSKQLLSGPLRPSDALEISNLLIKNDPRTLPDLERRTRVVGMCFALVMATEEWNLR